MALIREAQPLTPQAQGTSWGVFPATWDNPSGNGIPMQKARGAISNSVIPTLASVDSSASQENSTGNSHR